MNSSWEIRTGRLLMRPVGWADLEDLIALKSDPRSFAAMLGGVRSPNVVVNELACDVTAWSAHGFGMWVVRGIKPDRFVGLVGLHYRDDGRGVAIRFALRPEEQGFGYASESASAALRFGHERAKLAKIIAVASEDNFSSRVVLGSIGMRLSDIFYRNNKRILIFKSCITQRNLNNYI